MVRLKTKVIGPDGPLHAKLLFVGQAPGATEDQKGRPFQGQTGQLFNRCLRLVGLARSEVLVNNVFCQRPPKNQVGYFYQDKKCTTLTWEGQEHVDGLRNWLENLLIVREGGGGGPNVIVAFGREAMLTLTGRKRITKWRGSLLPCTLVPGFKVYPTFHPSFVQRLMNEPREALVGERKKQMQNALPLFLKDLERAIVQSDDPELVHPQRDYKILNNVADVVEELEKLSRVPLISCDIETLRGEDGPILWCIGFSPSPDYAFTIPIIEKQTPKWSISEEMIIFRAISEVFLNAKIQKVFQGGSYDLSILGRYYGLRLFEKTYQDTMLCHHASYPFIKKGLDTLASIYTWEPYYKDDGKVWDGRRISDQAEYLYNCKDCCVQREIYPIVERDAKELGTFLGYERTMSVFPSILYMQIRGVRIDTKAKDELGVTLRGKAKLAQSTLNALAEKDYNIGSPQQMAALLYSQLGMAIQYDHKTKRPTTGKDAINRLIKKHKEGSRENQILQAITDFRRSDKLASTYTAMEVDNDGRIHTSYSWNSTYSLASSESHFGNGGNLQNIPKRGEEGSAIRRLFIPDDGQVFIGADQSQAEAREVAWLAKDIRLIEYFQTPGFDVHWLRAKEVLGIPESVPYNPKAKFKSRYLEEEHTLAFYRRIGKTIVHAFNYKMGPIMLQNILIREGVYFSVKECKSVLQSVKNNNPLTVQWQNKVVEEIRATKTLITPLGRKRQFRGRLGDEMYRSATAFVPQSTSRELLQLSIQDIYSNCSEFEPLLNVHDEVVGQCKPEDVQSCMEYIKGAMEIPHVVNGRELIIPCEFKTGPSWGELEEIR